MKLTAITSENLDGFKYLLLPEAAAAIRRGETVGALGLVDEDGEIPAAAAAAAGMAEENEFRILSFMVDKKYRGRGFGKLLLEAYGEEAARFGLPISVEYLEESEDTASLGAFLTHAFFREISVEDPIVTFSLGNLDLSAFEDAEGGSETEVKKEAVLEELNDKELFLSSVSYDCHAEELPFLLAETFRQAKELYTGDTRVFAYIENDQIGSFIGRFCKNPVLLSRKYIRY